MAGMRNIIYALLIALVAPQFVMSGTLEQIYEQVRETGQWPDSAVSQEAIKRATSVEEEYTSKLIHVIVLTNEGSTDSLQEASGFLNEIESKAPNAWQRDYSRFQKLVLTGLQGQYEDQVRQAETVEGEVNVARMLSSNSDFISVQKDVFGLTPQKFRDVVLFLKASAQVNLGQIIEAERVMTSIRSRELREVVQGSIETITVMKSEHKQLSGATETSDDPKNPSENVGTIEFDDGQETITDSDEIESKRKSQTDPIVEPEESPKSDPLEIIEETTAEKSSLPVWPWIVGALMLLTALGLVLSRKKS